MGRVHGMSEGILCGDSHRRLPILWRFLEPRDKPPLRNNGNVGGDVRLAVHAGGRGRADGPEGDCTTVTCQGAASSRFAVERQGEIEGEGEREGCDLVLIRAMTS